MFITCVTLGELVKYNSLNMEVLVIKRFEYKFVKKEQKLGFSINKKVEDAEKEWNELGRDGWKFCKEGDGVIIFVREIIE